MANKLVTIKRKIAREKYLLRGARPEIKRAAIQYLRALALKYHNELRRTPKCQSET